MDYNKLEDIQLLDLLKSDNEEALNTLLYRYSYIVKSLVRGFFLVGGSTDDLIQEGMMGLYKSIKSYDITKNDNFRNYAYILIKNHIYDAIKSANRLKHSPLNNYISISTPSPNEASDNRYVLDTIKQSSNEPEQIVLEQERLADITTLLKDILSKKENTILTHYLTGMSYVEISNATSYDLKSIDNALQRIKTKLKKNLISQ